MTVEVLTLDLSVRSAKLVPCPPASYEEEWRKVDQTRGLQEDLAERWTPEYRKYNGPA